MQLKKLPLLLLIMFLTFLNLNAANFTKVASVEPVLVQKGAEKQWCPVCGMNIKAFYKTSHASHLQNETPRQYCSIRCLVVDMQEYGIDTNSIEVVDAHTQKFINAKSAFYVVNSKVKGTMSKVSKLAFASKVDAQNFIKKYKGKIVTFNEALDMAEKSLKSDIVMISKKKEKKIYPMGKKIFTKACSKDIDPTNYIEINELKSAIKNEKLCRPLKEKQLQALALYLWEVKRFEGLDNEEGSIQITKEEKCPVCGMFVYKYPRWAAQIFYGDKHYSFDGMKDLFKYYFDNRDGISKILARDYYSQKTINALEAYYVIGSDIYGPMGNELIAFKNESEAKTFNMDHRGTEVISFDDVTKDQVYKLDE